MKCAILSTLLLLFLGVGCAALSDACTSVAHVFKFEKRNYSDQPWYPRRAGDIDVPAEAP